MKQDMYDYLLHLSFPLNDAEVVCRQFRIEHPEKRLMDGRDLRIFLRDMIGLPIEVHTDDAEENVLKEDQLIPAEYNITALRHLRYLPGCLHNYDFFEIDCVLSGSCMYQMQGKSEWMREGDVVIFPPHKSHLIDVCSDDCILINILAHSSTFDRYFFSLFRSYLQINFITANGR